MPLSIPRHGLSAGQTGHTVLAPLRILALAGLLVGCAPGPDLDFPPGPPGDYPELVPIDALLAQADA